MSASKEKKLRSTQRSEGVDRKAAEAAEKAVKDKKFRRNTIIVVAVVIVLLVLALIINSSLLYTKTTAISIGGTDYTPAQFTYFYNSTLNSVYSELQNTYGDYASIILNPQTPLDQQQYSETQTWADYIYDATVTNMTQITALYDEAMAKGYTLTTDDETQISSAMGTLNYYSSIGGYSDTDAFLASNYCKGLTTEDYKELTARSIISASYSQQIADSFTFTDEQMKEEYAANKDEYDFYDFYAYPVYNSDEKFNGMSDEEKAAAAKSACEEMAKATTVEEFEAKLKEFAGDDLQVRMSTYEGNRLSSLYKDWLIDPARKLGDTTVVDGGSFSYALMFVARDDNNYHTVDTRHILVAAVADDEGNYTDESLMVAKNEAERLYALWQENPTQENFAEIASKNSADTGSVANGGLYEQVYKNEFVTEYNDFLFNSGSKAGDTAIVYGESDSYAGYHIVYYVGENMLACDSIASDVLRSNAYNEYADSAVQTYTVTPGFGMKFANLK